MASAAAPSIDTLFSTAVAQLQVVDDPWPALTYLSKTQAPSRPDRTAEATGLALDALSKLANAVHQAALISPNEDLDEIATRSLRHLLIPLLQARAHAQTQGGPRERYVALREARGSLEAFFERMERLGVLRGDRAVALEGKTEGREEKIARFKREKECERKLKALGGDEEDEREVVLMVLESAVRRGVEMVGGLEREMEILRFAVREMERGTDLDEMVEKERERAEREKEKSRMEGRGAFRIVSEREKIKEGVFKPGHNLPTYTVEEWGQMEMERMARVEKEKREKIVRVKTEEEEEEEERLEQSRWDDWKDEHNKGSGNTMR